MDSPFPIRPASFADAAAMAAVERRCFSDPWPLEGFREVLGMPGTVALVMTDADETIAYFMAREILGTAEVLNLAVVPEYRGRGLGAALLDAGLAAVSARGGSEIFLEVRASNAVAQALYARRGFRTAGRRRGYYRRPDEDALVLRLLIDPPRSNDERGGTLV
ncbi:MAG TPA: ribosomal protein S18-alanine N-acetyltransferase [Gemmatimonadales bacterium]|nr:ribosomal protein S18-alanine N-acetyltransferase [Gemmatimonadales bacterium]